MVRKIDSSPQRPHTMSFQCSEESSETVLVIGFVSLQGIHLLCTWRLMLKNRSGQCAPTLVKKKNKKYKYTNINSVKATSIHGSFQLSCVTYPSENRLNLDRKVVILLIKISLRESLGALTIIFVVIFAGKALIFKPDRDFLRFIALKCYMATGQKLPTYPSPQ